ncbi:DEAD/DEAH box helicase [Actibacterium sp.]|uniref:DEAD/DEAH box helicase n=1 Tax=Actibacterium sp. TaxID=1872125 RepID=UPI003568F2A3
MKQTIADALERRGYTSLTPVQEAVTNPDLTGADLLVSAQTGSGKTVGFGLAIAPTLLGQGDRFETAALPLALVIAPTRELALQVKRELAWLYADAGAVVASCVGGMDMRDERRALERGAHIVVATPGRLRDHIMRGSIDLGDLRAVVLDEADEMLDLGFREDLEFILGESPDTRQTLMFSATVPQAIAKLAESYQRDAIRVMTKAETSQHADIEYHAMNVSARDGENAIINVLRYYEAPNAIVFCNTRVMVNRLTTRLSNRGFSVVALSGELSQSERSHALQAMRDGRARVCVATDVAARGIDLPNLDLVVHAELPSNHETLLHRSGRTGRAGRKGVSALIVPPKSRGKAERILNMARLKAQWGPAPSAEQVSARDEQRMLDDPAWLDPISDTESDAVAKLVDRFSGEQIAAAYLRLYHSGHSAPEDLSDMDAPAKPRAPFGPSVWFSLSTGRAQNAEPRRILPMLCKSGDITKNDIGAIRVQQDETFFEIRQESVAAFLAAVGPSMSLEARVSMTQLNQPPAAASADRPAFAFTPKDRSDRKPDAPYKDRKSDHPKERKPSAYAKDDAPRPVKDRKPSAYAKDDAPRPVKDRKPSAYAKDDAPRPVKDRKPSAYAKDDAPRPVKQHKPAPYHPDQAPDPVAEPAPQSAAPQQSKKFRAAAQNPSSSLPRKREGARTDDAPKPEISAYKPKRSGAAGGYAKGPKSAAGKPGGGKPGGGKFKPRTGAPAKPGGKFVKGGKPKPRSPK